MRVHTLVAPEGKMLIEASEYVLEQPETMYMDWNSKKYYPSNKDEAWVKKREAEAKGKKGKKGKKKGKKGGSGKKGDTKKGKDEL